MVLEIILIFIVGIIFIIFKKLIFLIVHFQKDFYLQIGINHNGNISLAKRLISLASQSGTIM